MSSWQPASDPASSALAESASFSAGSSRCDPGVSKPWEFPPFWIVDSLSNCEIRRFLSSCLCLFAFFRAALSNCKPASDPASSALAESAGFSAGFWPVSSLFNCERRRFLLSCLCLFAFPFLLPQPWPSQRDFLLVYPEESSEPKARLTNSGERTASGFHCPTFAGSVGPSAGPPRGVESTTGE